MKPQRLSQGDVIGISSFAWLPRDLSAIDRGIEKLTSLGFRVKEMHCTRRECTPSEKLRDLHALISDDEVKAIISVRGGWGTLKFLAEMDMSLIAKNPKIIMGFSDLTTVVVPIYEKTGLVTFYGPMVASNFSKDEPYTVDSFLKVLGGERVSVGSDGGVRISGGVARGRLIGGCLSLLVTLIGTPYDFNTDGAILFFEDVGELPYRVDRMLTHMKLAGKFKNIKGIAIGKFNVEDEDGVLDVFVEHFSDLGVPVFYGLKFGHIPDIATIPIGVEAELDADKGVLRLLEPAVGL